MDTIKQTLLNKGFTNAQAEFYLDVLYDSAVERLVENFVEAASREYLMGHADAVGAFDDTEPTLRERIVALLSDQHPAELARLTGHLDKECKQLVHQIYLDEFGMDSADYWQPEQVGDAWALFGRDVSGEWIDPEGEYLEFETEQEALDYIRDFYKQRADAQHAGAV